MTNEEVSQLFKKYGLILYGRCSCIGPRTEKWKRPGGDYVIYWSKYDKKFRVRQHGVVITVSTDQSELKKHLHEYYPEVEKKAEDAPAGQQV